MDKKKTGELIKDARQKKGYTQEDLGDILGVTNKAISRWERGESFPDVALIESIAQALDLKIDEIILGESVEQESLALKDALQIVRAQARARRRTILECAVFALVIGALFVRLYCGFLTNRIYFGEYLLYHDWVFIALILLFVGIRYMVPARPSADTPLLHRWILIIWGILTVYLVGGFGYMMVRLWGAPEEQPFGLSVEQIGPFIMYQVAFIGIASFGIFAFLLGRTAVEHVQLPLLAALPLLTFFLSCGYAYEMHSLADPYGTVKIYIEATLGPVVNTCVILFAIFLYILHDHRKSGND